jgi:hypothetical protein
MMDSSGGVVDLEDIIEQTTSRILTQTAIKHALRVR